MFAYSYHISCLHTWFLIFFHADYKMKVFVLFNKGTTTILTLKLSWRSCLKTIQTSHACTLLDQVCRVVSCMFWRSQTILEPMNQVGVTYYESYLLWRNGWNWIFLHEWKWDECVNWPWLFNIYMDQCMKEMKIIKLEMVQDWGRMQ